MRDPGRIAIIGAGPTGLGAAYRLQELGVENFVLLEAGSEPGGLARSFLDANGFTWDIGGHVQFSHYKYYDEILDRALGDRWFHHQRESWVWIRNRFVPYPFQNNIHRLPHRDRDLALAGLEEAAGNRSSEPPENFLTWIESTFGFGIAEIFLIPYNRKVWGYPLHTIGAGWMGERVAVPDLDRIRENCRTGQDDVSWGPNSTFRFPSRGGTGAIWTGVSRLIDPERIRLGARVIAVDLAARRIQIADGSQVPFENLISSMPLDTLCTLCRGLPGETLDAAKRLVFSSSHILGIGLKGPRPASLTTKCWMYFPEANSPYYRVTVFSNYSPFNVPKGDDYWSLMAEVCETPHKPVDERGLRDSTLSALLEDGLITNEAEVVSFWQHRADHGYPTPFLGRDEILAQIIPELESHRIYSRGRFGAWRYEVSNQDHSFMQGVEVADRLLGIGEEVTVDRPEYVNSGVFLAQT